MGRKATGAVVEHVGTDGRVYLSLRFTAYGKRRFVSLGPVERDVAERKLRLALDQVAEGTWKPRSRSSCPLRRSRSRRLTSSLTSGGPATKASSGLTRSWTTAGD